MNKKTITENSFFLHRNMKINSYGSSKGYPLLVIPTQDGTADDYESFGMIETLKDYIDNNIIHVFCVDSVDKDSFSDIHGDKEKRIQLQEQYFNYINKEVVTYIHRINHSTNRILLTGNSMGGYHSANLFLRNPQTFEGCICLSGVYDASYFFDGWMNDLVKLNSPVHYLQDMKEDDPKVKLYQDRSIILCIGQGRWEEEGLATQPILTKELERLHIPVFSDYWGYDVDHDWPWWQKEIVYLLPKALAKVYSHYPYRKH
jgi:esterase/lipase superfamily enzyme